MKKWRSNKQKCLTLDVIKPVISADEDKKEESEQMTPVSEEPARPDQARPDQG